MLIINNDYDYRYEDVFLHIIQWGFRNPSHLFRTNSELIITNHDDKTIEISKIYFVSRTIPFDYNNTITISVLIRL